MISVIEVYNAVRDLANKDQKGFVSPAVFNTFAGVAQQAVFESLFENLVTSKSLRLRQADPGGSESLYRGVEDDLSEYVIEEILDGSSEPNITGDSNLFRKPDNFYKLVSLRVEGDDRTPIDLVYRADQMSHIISSNLSAPTELFPVALVSKSIEVFPSDVTGVVITYYRQPSSRFAATIPSVGQIKGDCDYTSAPRFAVDYNDQDGFSVPKIKESRDFDLPGKFKDKLIGEICKMIGVRLRDTFLSQYGQTQTN